MRDAGGIRTVWLADYQTPAFLVDEAVLDFTLDAHATLVKSRLSLRRNPAAAPASELRLDGVDLDLKRVELDGQPLAADRYVQDAVSLTVEDVPAQFTLATEVVIDPAANTALEGLYMSHGMFCTQCEAEGFRRITYYPDRPDVLSRFTVTVRGDKTRYPLLLSNGNPVASGADGASHWVTWQDPFAKPCYLFALVAGDLACLEDRFTTRSGRQVTLRIFAEAHDLDKLDHAMLSLKNAMRWDEETYGREYDLDLFMIVAVSHFNMGAMENKGLNVFNTSCVLASPATTTDAGFQRVESVVAHEYFHNWSGNRVTCRDWFQLSLKEGFTVHREHGFAAAMNSASVKRVQDADFLKSQQFPEDQGPMAHPVRPASYQKIDNFYTHTVYEKGAEVVRMQAQLLGPERFRAATDDYFSRFDGQAATVDDFVACMERASGRDLTQFKRWYAQAGTPLLDVDSRYADGNFTLTFRQRQPATRDQPEKLPLVIPVALALVGEHGLLPLNAQGDTETLLVVDQAEQSFSFQAAERPVPSLLRNFSAPVELHHAYSEADLARLLAHDTDGYCRWDAAQRLYLAAIERILAEPERATVQREAAQLLPLVRKVLAGAARDPAEAALLLSLPSETLIGDRQAVWQPASVHDAVVTLKQELAAQLEETLWQVVDANATPGAYRPLAADIGKRSLRWCLLGWLATLENERVARYLAQVFERADNMTDELGALTLLTHHRLPIARKALDAFADHWQDEALVMDKWFAIQATRPEAGTLTSVEQLLRHARFDRRNPNRWRALLGSFAMGNPVAFHQPSGAAYDVFFTELAGLDRINPQVAARMATAATRLKKLPRVQQSLLREKLERLLAAGCSDNLREVLGHILQ